MGPGVAPIRDRSTFRALARPEGRGSSGPISVSFVGDRDEPPRLRVGYAIGRRQGNAVRRNRIRRRVREGVRRVAEELPGGLPPGSYLVRAEADAATLAYPDLVRRVEEALTRASRSSGQPRRGPVR